MEDHWQVFAKELASLFAVMPGVDPAKLGDDPQCFLASYEPPKGLWEERHEQLRKHFVDVMDRRTFQSIYATFLEQRRKGGSLEEP